MHKIAPLSALLLALGFAGSASAQVFTLSTPSDPDTIQGTGVTGVTVTISYTAPAPATPAAALDIVVPAEFTNLVATPTNPSISGSPADPLACQVNVPNANRIRLSPFVLTGVPSGNLCTITFDVPAATPVGVYNFSTCSAGNGACVNGNATGDYSSSAFTVSAGPTPPTIGAGVFNAAGGAGTEGVVTSIGTIDFPLTTPASNGGSGSVLCEDVDAAAPAFTFNPSTAVNVTNSPPSIQVSCPLSPFGGGPVGGTARCTIIDSANPAPGRTENVAVNCPEGAQSTGPTLTPPATTDLTVSQVLVGTNGTASILFSATGGDPGQFSTLTCSVVSGPVTVSPLSQNVTTGSSPQAITVSVQLTDTAQPNVGVVQCNGTNFNVSAPAGVVVLPPEFIPASSLWSQLALILVFLGLGGLVLVTRRNG
jgi:hypothetical protein